VPRTAGDLQVLPEVWVCVHCVVMKAPGFEGTRRRGDKVTSLASVAGLDCVKSWLAELACTGAHVRTAQQRRVVAGRANTGDFFNKRFEYEISLR
jgi:hypothetical protein